ncbi:MAG: hypothetical protein ACM35F_09675, partial [Betaproteobacteria bacterium]
MEVKRSGLLRVDKGEVLHGRASAVAGREYQTRRWQARNSTFGRKLGIKLGSWTQYRKPSSPGKQVRGPGVQVGAALLKSRWSRELRLLRIERKMVAQEKAKVSQQSLISQQSVKEPS